MPDLKLSTLAAALFGVACLTPSAQAASLYKTVCKDHVHTTVGEHKVRDIARRAAVQPWVNEVAAHDGQSWSHIPLSAAQCALITPGTKGPWRCIVQRKPCRQESTQPPPSSAVTSPGLVNPGLTIQGD